MYNYSRAKFLIKQELFLFPKATMSDIYKLFYQNCRGSSHFCKDLDFVKDLICQEMLELRSDSFQYPDYNISYLFDVKRISLLSISIGKYDLNNIANKFMELASPLQKLSTKEWAKEWAEIKQLAKTIRPNIFDDINEETLDLTSSLHHSDIYRINYKPHYRICNL